MDTGNFYKKFIKNDLSYNLVVLILTIPVFFYFIVSIYESTTLWIFPDEIAATYTYQDRGYFNAIYYYWNEITINRVSASAWIFAWVKIVEFLDINSWVSWVVFRLLNFGLLIVSISYFLRCAIPEIKSPQALLISILFVTFVLLSSLMTVNRVEPSYFGFDHAHYTTSAAFFLILTGTLIKVLRYNSTFFKTSSVLCLLFLFLNFHEINLVLGGLLWGVIFLNSIFKEIKHDTGKVLSLNTVTSIAKYSRKTLKTPLIGIGFVVFFLSAALHIFAPAIDTRLTIWPTDTSTGEALLAVLPILESFILEFLGILNPVYIFSFLAGFLILPKFSPVNKKIDGMIVWFVVLAPFIFLITSAFLIGRVPALQVNSHVYNPSIAQIWLFTELRDQIGIVNVAPRFWLTTHSLGLVSSFILGSAVGKWIFNDIFTGVPSAFRAAVQKFSFLGYVVVALIVVAPKMPLTDLGNHFWSQEVQTRWKVHKAFNDAKTSGSAEIQFLIPQDRLRFVSWAESKHWLTERIPTDLYKIKNLVRVHSSEEDFCEEYMQGGIIDNNAPDYKRCENLYKRTERMHPMGEGVDYWNTKDNVTTQQRNIVTKNGEEVQCLEVKENEKNGEHYVSSSINLTKGRLTTIQVLLEEIKTNYVAIIITDAVGGAAYQLFNLKDSRPISTWLVESDLEVKAPRVKAAHNGQVIMATFLPKLHSRKASVRVQFIQGSELRTGFVGSPKSSFSICKTVIKDITVTKQEG